MNAFRFEMVCEMIAPDGTRTRVGSFPIPSNCLICGQSIVSSSGALSAACITRNNQNGLACDRHSVGGR